MRERLGTARDDCTSRAAGHPRGFAAGAGAPACRPSRRGFAHLPATPRRQTRRQHSAGAVPQQCAWEWNNMAKRTEGTKKLLNQVFPCVFLAVVYAIGAPIADGRE